MDGNVDAAGLQVVRLRPNIGAEIRGTDLAAGITAAQAAAIRAALNDHEVVILRDQHITADQQMAFARHFGELSIHPFSPNLPDKPALIVLDNSGDNPPFSTDVWHTDESFRNAPPMATILCAKVLPPLGGDTLFASMTSAFEGLSDRMQQLISGLEAVHDFKPFRALFPDTPEGRRALRDMEDAFPGTAHPIVRIHPETKRRVLFVNPQFTIGIKGMKEEESRTILDFLFRQARIPEYQFRLEWAVGTVAFWDNRSVQHYATHDYLPHRRTMQRVTIKGDPVVGLVDGTVRTADRSADAARNDGGVVRQFARKKS
ncbi:MAG: TauD/TfdA family dioxygenase [Rhodospirillaceae bacterium]|nr:TauD/TfdA family dioxygenase [Rhodospirillaceae bacterium]MDE0618451.1 TauD/TfdA family dioxygenase [Rhodospirillaceae bacterium]